MLKASYSDSRTDWISIFDHYFSYIINFIFSDMRHEIKFD
jgi:hypothetical protein